MESFDQHKKPTTAVADSDNPDVKHWKTFYKVIQSN